MEASITLKKVGKLIGDKTILASLTFGIERGSLVAIIGDNEAGKSMLLKVISGVENQEFGNVYINGLDLRKRRLSVISSIGFGSHTTWFFCLLIGAKNPMSVDKIQHP